MKFCDSTSDITKKILSETLFEEHMAKMPSIIYQVCRLCAHYLNADSASAWLASNGRLVCNMVINSPVLILDMVDKREKTGFGYTIFRTQRTLVIDDIQEDARGQEKAFEEQGLHSLIGTQIMFRNNCIGVMEYFRRVSVPFTNADAKIIELYSEMLTIALEHCAASTRGKVLWSSYLSHLIQELPVSGAYLSEKDYEDVPTWNFSEDMPKGLQIFTLSRIQRHLQQSEEMITCKELAEQVVLSVTSCRRYLDFLEEEGLVRSMEVKGDKGRPSKYYEIVRNGS